MKEFLSRAGVAYTVRNVDDDPGAFEELVRLGEMSIPFTLVGGRAVRGYDVKKLEEALAAYSEGPPDR